VYRPAPKVIEVHPCNVPPEDGEEEPPECPIEVPSVIGGTIDGARAALEAAGFTLVEGPVLEIDVESQDGLIVDQSPEAGDWVEAGTAIAVRIGVYVPPEEPPPDEG
jgi:beta-lactam-binding protein with PASTA domain